MPSQPHRRQPQQHDSKVGPAANAAAVAARRDSNDAEKREKRAGNEKRGEKKAPPAVLSGSPKKGKAVDYDKLWGGQNNSKVTGTRAKEADRRDGRGGGTSRPARREPSKNSRADGSDPTRSPNHRRASNDVPPTTTWSPRTPMAKFTVKVNRGASRSLSPVTCFRRPPPERHGSKDGSDTNRRGMKGPRAKDAGTGKNPRADPTRSPNLRCASNDVPPTTTWSPRTPMAKFTVKVNRGRASRSLSPVTCFHHSPPEAHRSKDESDIKRRGTNGPRAPFLDKTHGAGARHCNDSVKMDVSKLWESHSNANDARTGKKKPKKPPDSKRENKTLRKDSDLSCNDNARKLREKVKNPGKSTGRGAGQSKSSSKRGTVQSANARKLRERVKHVGKGTERGAGQSKSSSAKYVARKNDKKSIGKAKDGGRGTETGANQSKSSSAVDPVYSSKSRKSRDKVNTSSGGTEKGAGGQNKSGSAEDPMQSSNHDNDNNRVRFRRGSSPSTEREMGRDHRCAAARRPPPRSQSVPKHGRRGGKGPLAANARPPPLRHASTLSAYRSAFMAEVAQMSVFDDDDGAAPTSRRPPSHIRCDRGG